MTAAAVSPEGAVELLGGDAGLVLDGTMRYYADGRNCGCGTQEERGGLACGHMRAVRHAARRALSAGGGDRETAA